MNNFENLHGMIIFAKVVETMSYTEAAKTLRIAKSSVSKEIYALEIRLGAKLLQRTTRRIQVTEVGMIYYNYCYRILNEVKNADLFIRQFHKEPTGGNLRVVAPVTFGCQCIVPVLNHFVVSNIHVSIDLDLTDRPVNSEDEDFDIAVVITRDLPEYHHCPLIDIAWGLYAAPNYLHQLGKLSNLDDLSRHDFILFRGPAHTISLPFRKKKQKKDIEVRSRFRVNNSIALLNSAIAQTGIAYLPSYIAQKAVTDGRLVQLFADWEMDVYKSYILVKKDNVISPWVRRLTEALQKALSTNKSAKIGS